MATQAKVVFASVTPDKIASLVEEFDRVTPSSDELWVLSEFAPPRGNWVRYRFDRSFADNRKRLMSALAGRQVTLGGVTIGGSKVYRDIRLLAWTTAPLHLLYFNEHLSHFMLRPRSAPAIGKHFLWRLRELRWQFRPGGRVYTWIWRLAHPSHLRRPLNFRRALLVGQWVAGQKRNLRPAPLVTASPVRTSHTDIRLSVIIPSRNGRPLFERLLPVLRRELETYAAEAIVVDNGSDDGTEAYLREAHPEIVVRAHSKPMSFARAINDGLAIARGQYVCLLNNDMIPHAGFFGPLLAAFESVPELFCASAQIFFPEGRRREETGKAVAKFAKPEIGSVGFPIYCAEPIPGESYSPVLYGSGGCSLYNGAKLKALGGIGEVFEPAYVEDLDIGYRAWQCGWASVFVASASVTHEHRSTTSRYYSEEELEYIVERNYLRFLCRSIGSPDLFHRLWEYAIHRLNMKAVYEEHRPSLRALEAATQAGRWVERPAGDALPDELILGLGSGEIAVFKGRAERRDKTVLICSCYSPFPLSHGGAVRIYNLMKRTHGEYSQVLLTFVDELREPPPELLDICVEIVQVRRRGSHLRPDRGLPDAVEDFDSPAFRGAVRMAVKKWAPAIAQLEFTQMAQYARDAIPAKTLLIEHDITLDLYQQLVSQGGGYDVQEQLTRWITFERAAWGEVDGVVLMSEKDARTVAGAKRGWVLGNGVDVERYQPFSDPPERNRILFIGSFAHLPNLLALEFFVREVLPLLRTHEPVLHVIAGSNHEFYLERFRDKLRGDLAIAEIEIEGFVSDVRPAYCRAAVVIAPLLASAGTNIKVLEAMAMGKAVVSTTAGVNGLVVNPGKDVVVENDARAFAVAIENLFGDEHLRLKIGAAARAHVEAMYDWDVIAREQSRLYTELLKS